MLRWYPSLLLRVVLEITFVPLAFVSVFVVMVLFDRGTPWAVGSWVGPGPSPDFGKIAALVALGWALLVLGWRGARRAFKVLVVAWHLGLLAASIAYVVAADGLVVRGEAIGFSLSIGILGPAFSLVALVCALVWIARDSRQAARIRRVSPLRRRNRLAAALAVVGVAAAGLAFALDLDEFGAVVCFAATLAGHEALRPLNPSAELHQALVLEGSALE